MDDLRALADYALLAWRASPQEPSLQIRRRTLDLPDRSAVARLAPAAFGKWNSVWKQFRRCASLAVGALIGLAGLATILTIVELWPPAKAIADALAAHS
jgi:hypothetical protein